LYLVIASIAATVWFWCYERY